MQLLRSMKILFTVALILLASVCLAQTKQGYKDSLLLFRKNYLETHEVVGAADRKYFRFFTPDEKFRIVATFIKLADTTGFMMKTTGNKSSKYYKYGIINFDIDGKACQLRVYQSEQLKNTSSYKDYLFVPYTDRTSGNESYGGGKYVEFFIKDIVNNKVVIDFNKAYNPYCAYSSDYNCPIPPRENDLDIAIPAGEMDFGKQHP